MKIAPSCWLDHEKLLQIQSVLTNTSLVKLSIKKKEKERAFIYYEQCLFVIAKYCMSFVLRWSVAETIGLLGTGAQDGHLDVHTAPELWWNSLCLTLGMLLELRWKTLNVWSDRSVNSQKSPVVAIFQAEKSSGSGEPGRHSAGLYSERWPRSSQLHLPQQEWHCHQHPAGRSVCRVHVNRQFPVFYQLKSAYIYIYTEKKISSQSEVPAMISFDWF